MNGMKNPQDYLKELFDEPFNLDEGNIELEFLNIIKAAQFDAFRTGYYAGNYKCRELKGLPMMEEIILDDFNNIKYD